MRLEGRSDEADREVHGEAEIFLSYAREDRDRAEQLVRVLEREGFDVFWDRELVPGPRFREIIAEKLARAKCVIVLWSHISVKSDWVVDEAEEGKKRNVLVSVRIDDADPPLGFRQQQAANLSAWNGRRNEEVMRLIEGVRRLVGEATEEPPPATEQPLPEPEEPPLALVEPPLETEESPRKMERPSMWRHPIVGPTLLLVGVFLLNWLQTALDGFTTPASLGATGGYPVSEAFRWFEHYLGFEGHDATNAVAYVGYSVSYFFVFPLIALGVGVALAMRPDPLAYRALSLAVAIDYLVSLPFFWLLPVPERWFQPKSSAILLCDKWSDSLIEAIRPMSGLDNCFPSFHVSLTVLVVTACYVFDVRLKTCVTALGATVVLATFVLGIHWLPDIIAGFCLGIASLLLAVRWLNDREVVHRSNQLERVLSS